MNQKVILLGLNELNFDYIEAYIQQGHLPNFKNLFIRYGFGQTTSEKSYELLEPWIQWVSIHTGKTYNEHKVFRLGDIVERQDLRQLWEIAQEKGLSVGAISPFNARNNLKNDGFFVPDPWTQTTVTGEPVLQKMSQAVSNAVNNNANSSVSKGSAIALLRGVLKYVPILRWPHYLAMGLKLKRKFTKSAILDNILGDTFLTLWKKNQPDFSSLFLNAGAHIQHHYMFNSAIYNGNQKNPDWYIPANEDPLLDILKEYDLLLGRIMKLGCHMFVATGLHQKPHLHTTFYWRLKNHEEFLKLAGITSFKAVIPRMSRDFLIECNSNAEAATVQAVAESVTANGINVFTVDNRGTSLFVELTYDEDVKEGTTIAVNNNNTSIDLHKYVSFVAIKNGEHDGIGYLVDTNKKYSQKDTMPVTQVFNEIITAL
ncbi:MAG: alkaline phosphatase family protein [Ferruginibacter sp.]|nr:alkaline phosphatase family protein [Ferruginibacter sp.]